MLAWANMPDPFRHYEDVPVIDLPADPTSLDDGPAFLSQLLFYSAAVSATKHVPSTGYQYALRVNPSSGNLHPTEFHFATRGLLNWPDGLYHYRPSSHMAEQRALGAYPAEPVLFTLTSIAWREAWKYQSRAYRYCLLDIGHAWQALALSARALGCQSFARGHFHDVENYGLNQDEWPMLTIALTGEAIPTQGPASSATQWFGGNANRLSEEQISYPLIDAIHAATSVLRESATPKPAASSAGLDLPGFRNLARTRRSATDFIGGAKHMSRHQLDAILDFASEPLDADFATDPFIQLYLYVHRVEGLESGVYRLAQGNLELIRTGDQRLIAAALSLRQDLAGNACVAFSMIADLERATATHGDRGYRYAHFEAGAIGHRLYLAAEAHGLRGTGIGAFFDEEVHQYLSLTSDARQVVYHFAIGYIL